MSPVLALSSSPESAASLVAARPAALRALRRHQIDFWCDGRRTLDDACLEVGISRPALLAEIAIDETRVPPDWDWTASARTRASSPRS